MLWALGDSYTHLRNAHQGWDEGERLVLASHESVRDNIVFPLPEVQVVSQDLMES